MEAIETLPILAYQNTKTMAQAKVIKLTNDKGQSILIGTENIISIKPIVCVEGSKKIPLSEITSVGAMVTTNWVEETVDEIYALINQE